MGGNPTVIQKPLVSHICPIGSPNQCLIVGIGKDINFDIRNLAILFFLGMKLRGYQGITLFQHCDTTNKFDLLPLK